MNKTAFLLMLERRLIMLNDEERNDLLSEYEQHIDMKVSSGLSEEEAIADFGDPEELIKALLEAYHLNTNYQPYQPEETYTIEHEANHIKRFSQFFIDWFDRLHQGITNRINNTITKAKQTIKDTKEQQAIKQTEKLKNKPKKEKVSIQVPKFPLGTIFTKLLVWCCKFIAFFLLLCVGLTALALLAGSAAMLVFVISGYHIVGPFLAVLGCTLLALVVTGMLMQFIFGIGGASA